METIRAATAEKKINYLQQQQGAAATVLYDTVDKLNKKDKINIISIYGGFTAFKKNNFIKYHQFIRQNKNIISINLPEKDDKGKYLKIDDYNLIINEFKKLYLTQQTHHKRSDKIKFKIINAYGGYKTENGLNMIEKNKILLIGSDVDDFFDRNKIIFSDSW